MSSSNPSAVDTTPSVRTTPLPRRLPPPAVVSPPDVTPRRLKLPSHASTRAYARSAPRRLVSSRLTELDARDTPVQRALSPRCFSAAFDDDERLAEATLSPVDHISHTPARADNDVWLEQFGIDISLLRIYDSDDQHEQPCHSNDENQHPNLTPSRQSAVLRSARGLKATCISEPFELRSAFSSPEQESWSNQPITPRRLPAARSRRQSVKISQRELISIKQEPSLEPLPPKSSEPKQPLNADLGSSNTTTGSNLFLTPVRASRKQRLELGADTVVTPVRRSLRLSTKHQNLAPIDQPQARTRMLEQFGFTYTPNHSLQ
ncbi:hypothetical protein FGB62_113g125 [Gracilaria domingensis]|nr:hypothetical protein FGB62_113g125 [Gracilaria domingensis]